MWLTHCSRKASDLMITTTMAPTSLCCCDHHQAGRRLAYGGATWRRPRPRRKNVFNPLVTILIAHMTQEDHVLGFIYAPALSLRPCCCSVVVLLGGLTLRSRPRAKHAVPSARARQPFALAPIPPCARACVYRAARETIPVDRFSSGSSSGLKRGRGASVPAHCVTTVVTQGKLLRPLCTLCRSISRAFPTVKALANFHATSTAAS